MGFQRDGEAGMPKTKVFISYRRAGALHAAARIRKQIQSAFQDVDVFMDIDAMPIGVDFVRYLQTEVQASHVLLAFIDPDWSAIRDATGHRRLDDENDVVRVEVAAALTARIPVVPLVLDGASFPKADELPENLKPLSRQAGIELRGTSFDADTTRLLSRLEPLLRRDAISVGVGQRDKRQSKWLTPGRGRTEWVADCDGGPELVIVPAGQFVQGSPPDEPGRELRECGPETPSRQIVRNPFAIGRFAVTVGQFSKFVEETGHTTPEGADYWSEAKKDFVPGKNRSWRDPKFAQRDSHPVVAVNWNDARSYVEWLGNITGWNYRLPTSTEWEYAARAGTTTPFHWGHAISPTQANFDARVAYRGGGDRGGASEGTRPAGQFDPNTWGLHQVHGNAWEMCQDNWPGDASCRICRGGSFEDDPNYLRAAGYTYVGEDDRYVGTGFRVVRDIDG